MRLTLYGFREQYARLFRTTRLGSGARVGYGFLSTILRHADSLYETRVAAQARLVSLGREVNRVRGFRQEGILSQIAVLEHFLVEMTEMGY